jgi:hypothetical protein
VCAEGWLPLLETAFPPQEATIDDVREALEPYLVDSLPTSYDGTLETYAIAPGFLGPVHAIFTFDEAGVLVAITIED